jgi:hypothetical protein
MTDPQIFAWILISVTDRGGTLQDLIAQADAIMHTIPSDAELQKGLGWLIHCRLVQIQESRYLLTSGGRDLLGRVRMPMQRTMELWQATVAELSRFDGVGAPLHNLNPLDVRKAYAAYQKEFWSHYRKLQEINAAAARASTSSIGRSDFRSYDLMLPTDHGAAVRRSVASSGHSDEPDHYPKRGKNNGATVRRSVASLGRSDAPSNAWGNRFGYWAYENPRPAGALISACGVILVLISKGSSSHAYQGIGFYRAHYLGVLFIFIGLWMIVTNRSYHPEDKPPYWWNIGVIILVALTMVITW